MTTTHPTRYAPPSPARLVTHILDNPALVAQVRNLPAPILGRLIDSVGLEGAGDLIALATTEQLATVFDEDLWRSARPGEDPTWDAQRFTTWLEVMLEAGEQAVVDRLCELPLDFVTLAVHRAILVIDIDALGVELSEQDPDDTAPLEKALDSLLHEEWEELRLIARDSAAWDPMLRALLALDRDHHDRLRQILERCCLMSSEYIDDNGGLYDVLTSDEMLEVDSRAERDDRRAAKGYVSPSDARSFLALARTTPPPGPPTRDPITRAYFRELAPPPPAPPPDVAPLLALLGAAQAADAPAPRRLGAGRRLDAALVALRDDDPAAHAQRTAELRYLANVLISGLAHQGRQLRPVEALELALAVCELGGASAHEPLDLAFRRGWPRHQGDS